MLDTTSPPPAEVAPGVLPPGPLFTVAETAVYLRMSEDSVRRLVRGGVAIRPDEVVGRGGRNQRIQRRALLRVAGETES